LFTLRESSGLGNSLATALKRVLRATSLHFPISFSEICKNRVLRAASLLSKAFSTGNFSEQVRDTCVLLENKVGLGSSLSAESPPFLLTPRRSFLLFFLSFSLFFSSFFPLSFLFLASFFYIPTRGNRKSRRIELGAARES
jgi:hypothetical protein